MKGSAVVLYSRTKVLAYILSQGVEVYTQQQPVLIIESCLFYSIAYKTETSDTAKGVLHGYSPVSSGKNPLSQVRGEAQATLTCLQVNKEPQKKIKDVTKT